ncbi:hypothetical protein V6R21_10815 [Limibacter armeniacum]|uniref:hypothetical protein n=1 Tax=Limibacter armeniacum TaxID=466084 RepID=UPI002FE62210
MKWIFQTLILLTLSLSVSAQSSKFYTTSSGELIFSIPDLNIGEEEDGQVVRFSGFFNAQVVANFDSNPYLGFFGGLSIRNIGFIFDVPDDLREATDIQQDNDIRKKVRTYNLGVPIGIKIGKLDGFFIYGGYEIELPIHYKEKTFVNEDKKDKFNVWFSDRVDTFTHSFFVGLNFPHGTNIKFKYYVSDFFSNDYNKLMSRTNLSYKDLDVNVFYFSLSFNLFKDDKIYYIEEFSASGR